MLALRRPTSVTLTVVLLAGAAAAVKATPLVLHLSASVAALALGLLIMLQSKGTASHQAMGRAWVGLMTLAAASSFWLTGLREGFSAIHLLSVWTLVAMALAVHFVRKGDVRNHKRFMIGTFLGLAAAAIGALMPGRTLFFLFWGPQ